MIILGISGGLTHDPAACLVVDGQLVAAVEEERFLRIKKARRRPAVHAALYCLQEAGLGIEEVDLIATSWNPNLDDKTPYYKESIDDFTKHKVFASAKLPEIMFVDHHTAHASASFYSSGFDEATILIVDGQGEDASTSIYHGKGKDLKRVLLFDVSQSLGYFYNAVTRYIGFNSGEAGKTMGLAPYGKAVYDISNIRLTADGYHIDMVAPISMPVGLWYEHIKSQWMSWLRKNTNVVSSSLYDFNRIAGNIQNKHNISEQHKNLAASAQKKLEEVLLHLVSVGIAKTGSRNLVLGGGVALNCTANGLISANNIVDDLYIFPAAHDAGGAVGAAFYAAAIHGETISSPILHAHWGPSYSNDDILFVSNKLGINVEYHDNIGDFASEIICRGAVIGWFQGRMEIGPRALGARSILADPSKSNNLERVNRIKGREFWRPLAPSILEAEIDKLVERPTTSPFMLKAFQVKSGVRATVPAITHIDNSTRPQTVTHHCSQEYNQLLIGMKQRIGLPIVLNTSFNDAKEPIVCTPLDAIKTFYSTGLDALVMGNYVISKNKNYR